MLVHFNEMYKYKLLQAVFYFHNQDLWYY